MTSDHKNNFQTHATYFSHKTLLQNNHKKRPNTPITTPMLLFTQWSRKKHLKITYLNVSSDSITDPKTKQGSPPLNTKHPNRNHIQWHWAPQNNPHPDQTSSYNTKSSLKHLHQDKLPCNWNSHLKNTNHPKEPTWTKSPNLEHKLLPPTP